VPGRFPLLTDENVPGPLIDALRSAGWDILHARDLFGESTDDDVLIEHAARRGRVLVSTDQDHLQIAHRWIRAGRPFRMVWWRQAPYQRVRPRAFVEAFDELAARTDDPFRYPICYLKPKA
jgi:predicted nuclease of predicted toxin-antitoxin system